MIRVYKSYLCVWCIWTGLNIYIYLVLSLFDFLKLNLYFNPLVFLSAGEVVTGVDLYVTEQYINGTYSSCSQVSVPSTGQRALDLMCGDWGASRCNPTKWFFYMGDKEGNSYVPFQINYLQFPNTSPVNGHVPHSPKITPCNEAFNVSLKKIYVINDFDWF